MSLNEDQSEPKFELVKPLRNGVWTAIRKGDPRGEQFLARRVDTFNGLAKAYSSTRALTEKERKASAYKWLLGYCHQDDVRAQIFNHENLVSLVGKIHLEPFVGSQKKGQTKVEEYLVWDFCDAANLSVLFDDLPRSDPSYYLPESLCWHVLRSLTRALAWLHDGVRLEFDPSKSKCPSSEYEPKWSAVDQDWLPILHREIKPVNIYFQHPRGIETYGLCKLGDFSKAAVTGHPVRWHTKNSQSDISYSVTCREGWECIDDIQDKMRDDQEQLEPKERVYSLDDELYSIGVVIFTMMTGHDPTYCCRLCGCSHITYCPRGSCLPPYVPCDCLYGGCEHIGAGPCKDVQNNWLPCIHKCSKPTIHVSGWLLRARYTSMLRTAVQELILRYGRYEPHASNATRTATSVERGYREWREMTAEGREYRDIEDDMAARWEASEQRRMEEEGLKKAKGGVAYVI